MFSVLTKSKSTEYVMLLVSYLCNVSKTMPANMYWLILFLVSWICYTYLLFEWYNLYELILEIVDILNIYMGKHINCKCFSLIHFFPFHTHCHSSKCMKWINVWKMAPFHLVDHNWCVVIKTHSARRLTNTLNGLNSTSSGLIFDLVSQSL